MDFSTADESEETYDPSKSVMLTAQKTEDIAGGAQQGGIPGTPSNLPRPAVRPPGSGYGVTRSTENIAYQTSRSVRRTRVPQGALKRMSLSVLVDQNVRFEGKGAKAKRILEPPAEAKLKTIRELVAAATGFSEKRGDLLTVETLPFESTLGARAIPDPAMLPALVPEPASAVAGRSSHEANMPAGLLIGAAANVGVALMAILPIAWLLFRKTQDGRLRGAGSGRGVESIRGGGVQFRGTTGKSRGDPGTVGHRGFAGPEITSAQHEEIRGAQQASEEVGEGGPGSCGAIVTNLDQ